MESISNTTQTPVTISAVEAKKNRRVMNMEEFFRMICRNWRLFLLCLCLALGVALVYLNSSQPVYQRVSDLEIMPTLHPQQEDRSAFSEKNDLSHEMEDALYVFRSLKLAREVSSRLHLDVLYYHKGTVVNRYLYEDRPFTIHFNDAYRQDVRICVRPTSAQTFIILSVEQNGETKELPNDVPPYFFGSPLKLPVVDEEVELTVDNDNYNALMASLDEDVIIERISLDRASERCQSMMSVDHQTNSVVRLTCRANSVMEADDILRTVASVYNAQSKKEKLQVIDSSSKFIEERIAEAAIGDSLVLSDQILAFDQSYKADYMQYLLRRREELMLQKTVIDQETRVIEDPMGPADPVAPVARRVILRFLLIGLLIPFVLMLLNALMTTTVRGRKDVESTLAMPVMGILPKYKKGEASRNWFGRLFKKKSDSDKVRKIVISPDQDNKLVDSFRILRSNLSYMGVDSSMPLPQVMLFSSLTKHSGKSFVSVNLASVLASDSYSRCLWIDMDINYEHQYLNLISEVNRRPDMPGLTSFLSGKAEIKDCIHSSAENPSLDILLSGPVPPNPTQLLMSERLALLLASLRKTYKYIIINSGISPNLSMASICSRYVDMTAFVVRVDRTTYKELDQIEHLCQSQRFKNPCCVITETNVDHSRLFYAYKTGEGYELK